MCKITSVGGLRRKGCGSGCLSHCIDGIDAANLVLGNREGCLWVPVPTAPLLTGLRPGAVSQCQCCWQLGRPALWHWSQRPRSPLPPARAQVSLVKRELVEWFCLLKCSCHPAHSSTCAVRGLLSSLYTEQSSNAFSYPAAIWSVLPVYWMLTEMSM